MKFRLKRINVVFHEKVICVFENEGNQKLRSKYFISSKVDLQINCNDKKL